MTAATNATARPSTPRLILMTALGTAILLGLLAGSLLTGSGERARAQDGTPSTPVRLRLSDIVKTQQAAAQTGQQNGVTIEEPPPNLSIIDIRNTATAAAASGSASTVTMTSYQTGVMQAIIVGIAVGVAIAVGALKLAPR